MEYGFIKVATASPLTNVADCKFNVQEITSLIDKLSFERAELITFPELCITSRNCGSLFTQPFFIKKAEEALCTLLAAGKASNSIIVVGMPVEHTGKLYNCAIVMHRGNIKGVTAQNHPDSPFASSNTLTADATIRLCGQEVPIGSNLLYRTPSFTFGIEIGDDAQAPLAPSALQAVAGADIILNPAATGAETGSIEKKKEQLATHSRQCLCGYLYANAGYGESTSNAVYSGYNTIYENGTALAESAPFTNKSNYSISEIDIEKLRKLRVASKHFAAQEAYTPFHIIEIAQEAESEAILTRTFDASPFTPQKEAHKRYEEIFTIQALALAKRIEHTRATSCVIGISGGLDSTLALLVTAQAFDTIGKERNNIIAVTMPGFGTTDRTYKNAITLMESLGVTTREIPIREACIQHFKDIEHNIDNHDVTYENSQARERTQILMDIANQCNGIVVGTGDLSELALGWATYNGDHMSMYGVNASVPKTLMQHIVRYAADKNSDEKVRTTLLDIVDTPISPELIPADEQGNIKQKTEDLVGPYELHDFFLYNFVRYGFSPAKIALMAERAFKGTHDRATIKKWLTTFLRRFFTQQFKRSCMPDSPKVGSCNLNPQSGWTMPSDTNCRLWMEECERL
ncbi:MAG: NAD(+) synthase [Bacteroidaceae bacterium]|nr:NAD(+) synthase [Bacteroidaceae bacterium]